MYKESDGAREFASIVLLKQFILYNYFFFYSLKKKVFQANFWHLIFSRRRELIKLLNGCSINYSYNGRKAYIIL